MLRLVRWWEAGRGWRLMFHLLLVSCYLDYEQTDWGGGYLGLSPSCLEGLFHFTARLHTPPTHTHTDTHPVLVLSFSPSSSMWWRPIAGLNPCFLFPFIRLPFLHLALLRRLYSPLFCGDIKQLSACIFACLQCAGHTVLLSVVYMQVLWGIGGCDYSLCLGLCTFCI